MSRKGFPALLAEAILQCFASLPIADGLHRRLGPVCSSIVDANLVMAHFFGCLVQRWGRLAAQMPYFLPVRPLKLERFAHAWGCLKSRILNFAKWFP